MRWCRLSVKNTLLDEYVELMACDRVFTKFFVEIEATSSLQSINYFKNLRVLQDFFDLLIVLNSLHHWVIFHLFLLLLFLLFSQVVKVIAAKRTELHQELLELWIVSILLHGLFRF